MWCGVQDQWKNASGVAAQEQQQKTTVPEPETSLEHSSTHDDPEAPLNPRRDGKPMHLFVNEEPLDVHVRALRNNRERYIVDLLWNVTRGLVMTQSTKVRTLVAAWGSGERELAAKLLLHESFGVPVVLGAVQMLDSRRQLRQLRRRLDRMTQRNRRTVDLKTKIDALVPVELEVAAVQPELTGFSGALQRHVARWVRQIPKDKLEFWLLALPQAPWVDLAQVCHLNPRRDFAVPWFLSQAFGERPPAGSLAAEANDITTSSLADKVAEWKIPYSYVRRRFAGRIPDSAKVAMARYMPLDQLIWFYDDASDSLATDDGAVERILTSRLASGESPTELSAGKLMERLLTFLKVGQVTPGDTLSALFPDVPATSLAAALNRFGQNLEYTAMQLLEYSPAEIRRRFPPSSAATSVQASSVSLSFVPMLMQHAATAMAKLSLPLERPVFIMGDASASMQVAVSTSTILASLIAAVSDAGLCFFSDKAIQPPVVPRTVDDVVAVAKAVKADGATCPAAALWPLLVAKQVVRQIVVVSDEEENSTLKVSHGQAETGFSLGSAADHIEYSFAELFAKYESEVSPGCRITFVSFLSDLNSRGQMVEELEQRGYTPQQFKLHRDRPDLTKTDAILGSMCSGTHHVAAERVRLQQLLCDRGIDALAKELSELSIEDRGDSTPCTEKAAGLASDEAAMQLAKRIQSFQYNGVCSVCFQDTSVGSLCPSAACTASAENYACADCTSKYFTLLIDSTLYAAPPLVCMAAGCGRRIPVRRWRNVVERETARKFEQNAQSLLTLRCPECDEQRSLLPEFCIDTHANSHSTATLALLKRLRVTDSAAMRQLSKAWRQYAQSRISATQMLSDLSTVADQAGNYPFTHFGNICSLLELIEDVERRASLAISFLNHNPFLRTPCCSVLMCFKCKVEGDHDGLSCETFMRREGQYGDVQYCPACGVATMKSEGCNEMICVCGEHWNWDGGDDY